MKKMCEMTERDVINYDAARILMYENYGKLLCLGDYLSNPRAWNIALGLDADGDLEKSDNPFLVPGQNPFEKYFEEEDNPFFEGNQDEEDEEEDDEDALFEALDALLKDEDDEEEDDEEPSSLEDLFGDCDWSSFTASDASLDDWDRRLGSELDELLEALLRHHIRNLLSEVSEADEEPAFEWEE